MLSNEFGLQQQQLIIFFDRNRFTVTSSKTSNDDILKDWAEVRKVSTELLEELNIKIGDRAKVPLKGIFRDGCCYLYIEIVSLDVNLFCLNTNLIAVACSPSF